MIEHVWVLVVLWFGEYGLTVEQGMPYKSMNDCFKEREKIVQEFGRPVVEYQVVCVQTSRYFEEKGEINGENP